jgi:ketosteroid isomerase-like protein
MFHRLIARQARRTFAAVNAHDYDQVLAGALPDMRHRFGGDHALGGERHDAAHVRLWFERLHRVVPGLIVTVTDVWVSGGLRRAVVIVRWTVSATLLDGDAYTNRGVHIIHLHNRKIYSIDVHEDSQAVSHALHRQSLAGLTEASAAPIIS